MPEPARTDTERHPTGDPVVPGALGVIVLAAGAGSRMKSDRAKVLHAFAGRSLLGHVLAATSALAADVTVVVVGHAREHVTAHLHDLDPAAVAAVQAEQRGTGHAVRIALDAVPADQPLDTVLVLPADAPLLRGQTLAALLADHRSSGAAATMLTSSLDDPSGYGRVLRAPDGSVTGVVEHRDASAEELLVTEVSALVYAFDAGLLRAALARVGTDNAQGEEYLPDVVAILRADGHTVRALIAPAQETAGVNDRVQLAQAHRVLTDRLLDAHMRAGVTVLDPASTWVDADVRIERDVTLLPGVHLLAGTTVATGAVIGPDCTITATTIGPGATVNRAVTDGVTIGARAMVGPFAYLRGGAEVGESAKVGTFVEVKNSHVGARSKVPHLSYVGDATIGERSNIGAATIFANYDGRTKNRSVVGDDVRIGSDTVIVAPVHIGNGAYTGAGTVVREDVPADALAVSMGKQRNLAGRGASARNGQSASARNGQSASARNGQSASTRVEHSASARNEQGASAHPEPAPTAPITPAASTEGLS